MMDVGGATGTRWRRFPVVIRQRAATSGGVVGRASPSPPRGPLIYARHARASAPGRGRTQYFVRPLSPVLLSPAASRPDPLAPVAIRRAA